MAKTNSNGYGIASLVLGISSIVLAPLGLITGILGIIFAVKQKKSFPNGIATAGFVTSIVGLAISILVLVLWSLLFAALFSASTYPY